MIDNYDEINPNAIAVIGIACRFPGAKNIDEFWHNLINGIESISYFSEDEVVNSGVDIESAKNTSLIKAFGLLEDADKFDAEFFGFSPREAELLDPQIRMFLECAWEAMENAAYDTDRIDGRVGVYASSSLSTYLLRNLLSNKELLRSVGGISAQLGNDKDHIPTRVSYAMNLKGPSIAIGTACSSSLVAVHLACQGLLDYHCDMAIAGGVTIHSNQVEGYFYNDGGIASPDGHCRTFDSKSGGTISGCGAGSVVLKRLEDAVRDNDNIYAVVLSSAVNNDGSVKVSYTAPGIDGQSEVIAEAYNLANINPETITYVETHGTATKLGDPIEIAALKRAFSSATDKKSFCAIGSVKSNVGHLDSAAGIAGFIKTVLSLTNKQIPPSIHFENPNPALNINDSPFYVNNGLSNWTTDGTPRRAGVSSFAMGGTNAHVILQEVEEDSQEKYESQFCVIPISAKTENALHNYTVNLFEELRKNNKRLEDIAYTFQVGRKAFKYRKAVVAKNTPELLKELNSGKSKNTFSGIADSSNTDIVFMFSGLGSHYENMGFNLFNSIEVFRKNMINCSNIFKSITGEDLINIIYPGGTDKKINPIENTGIDFLKMVRGEESMEDTELDKVIYAHPAIFSVEYSLAQMCLDFGIKPSALIGHSIGEYSALCISGALSLQDALNIIIKRARILESAPAGEMLTVDTTEESIIKYLNESLSIAAVNDSSSCVIAGLKNDIGLLRDKLNEANIIFRPVKSQRAFHSHLLESKEAELKKIFEAVHFQKPEIPIISNLTGDWLTEDEMTNPDYWVSHTTKTVLFYKGIQKLFEENYIHFLEIGTGQNLAAFVLKSNPKSEGRNITVNTTMKNVYDNQPDYGYYMSTLARLWTVGVDINWERFYKGSKPRRIPLPSYPFERNRYWIDENRNKDNNRDVDEQGGITYLTWKKLFSSARSIERIKEDSHWLIFGEPGSKIDNLTKLLKRKGVKFITVLLSDKKESVKRSGYVINPNNKNAFVGLFEKFDKKKIKYKNIIYLTSSKLKENIAGVTGQDILPITGLLKILSQSSKNFKLTFLLENAFKITGSEIVNPANAALYGFIKSISEEFKNIKTFCFETEQPDNNNSSNFYSDMLDRLLSESDERVIAFRGKSRWIPGYCKLPSGELNTSEDKPEKVLVLGNNDKLKKIIVDELNELKNKKIIYGHENLEINNSDSDDFISLIEKQIDKKLSIKSIEEYEGLNDKLDKLCGVMAANYLYKHFEWKAGEVFEADTIGSTIIEKYQKFFNYLLRITAEDGYIAIDNDRITILKGLDEIDIADKETEIIKKEYPQYAGMIKILEYAVSKYHDALSGKLENVNVFDQNESVLFNDVFNETPLRYEKQKIYINTVRELLRIILDKTPTRKINILEVGGGTGKLTGNLIGDLRDKYIEYHFTDIGKSFVVDAKKMSEILNVDFMKFDKFDISKDPQKQGIDISKYDIVLAYDVIHATENIKATMKNLEAVTAPGGIMVIIESVHPSRWSNMSWGLQTGWWYFNDFRNENMSPLITLDDWDKILNEFNMSFSATYPVEEPRRSSSAFGLIVAQKMSGPNHTIINMKSLIEELDGEFKNKISESVSFDYNPFVESGLKRNLKKIKKENRQIDTIFLCEKNICSIPIILRDYEHHKDEVEFQINRINVFIDSLKESGILKGELNIVFEKPNNYFHADESIIAEYINGLSNETDYKISSIITDGEHLTGTNKPKIIDVAGKISSTQIYISPDKYGGVKKPEKRQALNEFNIYSRPVLNNHFTEPQNDIEKKLVEIWRVMFGIEQIGTNDDFFELGGDSLMATKIITRIKNELDVVIKIPEVFQNPTIKAIAEKIISTTNMRDELTSKSNGSEGEREEWEI